MNMDYDEVKGHYKSMAVHKPPTLHDKIVMKFLKVYIPPEKDYYTSVEVYDAAKTGQVDIVIEEQENTYNLIEVKTKPEQLDEAIGQILRYKFSFADRYKVKKERLSTGIVCPSFYPSHKQCCSEIGIKLWEIQL